MPSNLEALNKKVQSLKDKYERLEKDVRGLKDVLNIHDNWNAEVRKALGTQVVIVDVNGTYTSGILKWADRYNLCLETTDGVSIYNKGSIVQIRLV